MATVEIAHDVAPWGPWSPWETARRFTGVDAPWGVAAGWALELYVGEAWREHEDLEVAVPASRFDELCAALGGLEFWVPVGGGRLRPLAKRAAVRRPSRRGASTRRRGRGGSTSSASRPPVGPGSAVATRAIRLPFTRLLERTADEIPFVRPEVVLLFKAKHAREKDEEDFDVVLPRLDRERRSWLRDALHRVHPGHPWLARLDV